MIELRRVETRHADLLLQRAVLLLKTCKSTPLIIDQRCRLSLTSTYPEGLLEFSTLVTLQELLLLRFAASSSLSLFLQASLLLREYGSSTRLHLLVR